MSSLTEPIEPAGPEEVALAKLRDSVRILDKRTRRGEGQRKWMWAMVAALLIAVIALLVLYADVIMSRSNSRQYYNGQLHDLACGLVQFTPPGDELGDQLRAQYDCPAYSPRRGTDGQDSPHSALPDSSTTPTVRTSSPSVQAAGATSRPTSPQSTRTVVTRRSREPQSARPSTSKSPQPRPTRTRTVTATPHPVRSVVCAVLGLIRTCSPEAK